MKNFWTGTSGTLLRNQRLRDVAIDYRKFLEDGFRLDTSLFGALGGSQVIHSAALVGESNCQIDFELTRKVNVAGAARLAETCAESGVERFVYISTSHVYAPSESPIAESGELQPRTLYAESKIQGEEAVLDVGKNSGMKVTIFRLFSFLGEASVQTSFAGLLARIVDGSGEKIRYSDDIRDFQTPGQYWDLMNALLNVSDLPEVVNVASGIGMSIAEASRSFAFHKGISLDSSTFEGGTSNIPFLVADVSLLKVISGRTPHPLAFI